MHDMVYIKIFFIALINWVPDNISKNGVCIYDFVEGCQCFGAMEVSINIHCASSITSRIDYTYYIKYDLSFIPLCFNKSSPEVNRISNYTQYYFIDVTML